MNPLPSRVQSLFLNKSKAVCFGQFVVEVPDSATVVYGPTDVAYPIDFFVGEAERLRNHVETRLIEVEKERRFLAKSDLIEFPLFGKVVDGIVPGQKLVFGSKDPAFYSIDSFIPIGKDLFVQHASTAVSKVDAIASLNMAAKQLRGRLANEVPTEPGACIEGGFVAWRPEFERASIGVRFKEFPDVHFSIQVIKNQEYLVESSALEPLLHRAEKETGHWYSTIKFLRRGPRQLGAWHGSEALARMPAQKENTDVHEFAFIALGAPRDPLLPSIDIKLDTGVKDDNKASVKPSLTDEEAVALWDKLTSSIRVRPTGEAAKKEGGPAPITPLGELFDSGTPCPQSGWWKCSDHGEIADGRRRHFIAGELMPQVVLLGAASAWQRLTGQRTTHTLATYWHLIEYDPIPLVPGSEVDSEAPPDVGVA